ncbi:MAG: ribonuclease, partial [Acidimicrobiales bacterium]|nr:ribonuclease [Acidimicrobiales bacterium]
QPLHSAVAAPYAHATAPIRRLADRFVSEVCLALVAGDAVPVWARSALPALPALMATADQRAHALDRSVHDLAEALVLRPLVGRTFAATVVEADGTQGTVQLREPAVRARCLGSDLPVGEVVSVRLVTANPATRTVEFEAI